MVFAWRKVLAFLLLWLYFGILFSFQAISIDIEMTVMFVALLIGLSCILSCSILQIFSYKIAQFDTLSLPTEKDDIQRYSWSTGVLVTAITSFILVVYFMGQYPGGMSPDTVDQYAQAVGEKPYNNWHPVLHTLIFFTLPLKLGQDFNSIVLLQLLYFSFVFGYLAYVLDKKRCPRSLLAVICLYVWVNPFIMTYMMYPWKDIGMTIFAILLIAFYIQIIFPNARKNWLENKFHLIIFSATVVVCSIMRHNAVLFTAPLVFLVLFYALKTWKTRIAVILCIAMFLGIIKITYNRLDVISPNRRVVETVGLPATVWCNVMKRSPQYLPEETLNFFRTLASPRAYSLYAAGSFNSIKFLGMIDLDKIDAMSYYEVLKHTYHCLRHAPKASLEALVKLTDIVWAIDGKDGPISAGIYPNNWGIVSKPDARFEVLIDQMKSFFSSGFGNILFGSIGFEMLILFIVAACMFAEKRLAFLHITPLFCYNFGTMLLLSGPDYRFFLYSVPLWPVVLFIIFYDKKI